MYNQETINTEIVLRCLDELYQASQPSISWEEAAKEKDMYQHHYLSNEEYKYITDKYIDIYRLNSEFDSHCDILIRDMVHGYYTSKEFKPSLKETLGEDTINTIVDFINERKNFYKFDFDLNRFKYQMMNYSPTSNKETVLKYWEEQGKPITIEDRNPDDFYDLYYVGLTPEEIEEERKFENE